MSNQSADDRGPAIVKLSIAMIVVPTVAVALRFWSQAVRPRSKSLKGVRIWWDDWLALIDLPFGVAQSAITIYWTSRGLGKHVTEVPLESVREGLIILYAGYFLYDIGISLAKLSALCFYARVFNVGNGRFRLVLWSVAGLVFAWLLFATISSTFQCTPIRKSWEPMEPGYCLNTYQWWLGSAISSVIIDAIILILPLPLLWRTQIKPFRKFLITCVFICGYCVIAVSIGRLVAVSQVGSKLDEDVTYNTVSILYWLTVETPISIVSICLPTIFFLVKRGIDHGPRSLFTARNFQSRPSAMGRSLIGTNAAKDEELSVTLPTNSFDHSREKLHHHGTNTEYSVKAFKVPSQDGSEPDTSVELPEPSIRVRREVDVSAESNV